MNKAIHFRTPGVGVQGIWSKSLFYGLFARINSIWENSEMAATGVATPEEAAILKPLVDEGLLPASILTDEVPMASVSSDANNLDRKNLRKASALLDEAGWTVGDDGILVATMNLPADWMSSAASGVKSLLGSWQDSSADASGTAGYFRIYASNGTTCGLQGTVTATGGGGDIQLSTVTIVAGQSITITNDGIASEVNETFGLLLGAFGVGAVTGALKGDRAAAEKGNQEILVETKRTKLGHLRAVRRRLPCRPPSQARHRGAVALNLPQRPRREARRPLRGARGVRRADGPG